MCFIHEWEKWEQYEISIPERKITKSWMLCAVKEYRQRKKCKKCGKVKDEIINTVVIG